MSWLCAKENKPVIHILALVSNSKGWMSGVKALYYPKEDVWVLFDPIYSAGGIILEVTHYIVIPDFEFDPYNKENHDKSI